LRYTVSPSGPGSPGNESYYFRSKTEEALKTFQEDHNIQPTGALDPQTRTTLNNQLVRLREATASNDNQADSGRSSSLPLQGGYLDDYTKIENPVSTAPTLPGKADSATGISSKIADFMHVSGEKIGISFSKIGEFFGGVAVTTVEDVRICIKSADNIHECLSSCGVVMDVATATSLPAASTGVGAVAPIAVAGLGALCDTANGLAYFVQGDKIQGGASIVAIVPGASITKQGAKPTLKISKESAEFVARESAKKFTFKSQALLDEHYAKHGKEFGNISKSEYLEGAQKLVNSTAGSDVLIKNRTNGDKIFYNKTTNEFAVMSADGTIRTYFKPREGINYFNGQQ
jgi:hypothetical protein